jgi:hypothetical protein
MVKYHMDVVARVSAKSGARHRARTVIRGFAGRELEALEPRLLLTVAMGVNLEGVADFSRSFMFADAMKAARHFGTVDAPWDEAAPVDANGWPVGDAAATIIMLDNNGPTPIHIDGTYHFSAVGRVTVSPAVTNAYVTNWHYDELTDKTTADVVVNPGAQALHLNFTGDPDGAKDIHLWRPGTGPGDTFTPEFLQSLEGAQTLRLMDFTRVNTTDVTEWADRAKTTDARQSDVNKGAAWEYAIELANTLDKDLWVNVPGGATDDYVEHMAALFHSTLEPGRHVYLEYSNEVWNGSFWRQFWTNYGKAQEDVANNPSDLNWDNANNTYQFAWRRIAKRLLEIRDIFAEAYGPGSINTTLRPVLASQIAWAYVLNDQLSYLQHRLGRDLSDEIYAVAGAPYMSLPSELSNAPGLTVDQVFAGLTQDLANMQAGIQKFEALANEHNLNYLFYEGGIDLQGDTGGNFAAAKLPANYDARMADLVRTYLTNAFNNGVDGVMYYGHISAYTSWGTWGLTDSVQALDAPKMQGFRSFAAGDTPAETTGIALPTGVGGITFSAGNFLMDVWATTGGGGTIEGTNAGATYTYLLQAATAGDYTIQLAAATGDANAVVEVYVDGASVGQVPLSATGGGTNYVNTSPLSLATVPGTPLGAGHHALRLRVVSGSINLQSLTIGAGGYEVAHPPAAPGNPAAVSASSTQVTVTWSDVTGETGYRVERSTDGTTWGEIALLAAGVTMYADTAVAPNTKYWYRVRAASVAGDSPYSGAVSAKTLLPAPGNVTATAVGTSAVELTWTPVAGAASYLIERSLNGKTWTAITRVSRSTSTYTDWGLSAKTCYRYRVFAVSLDGTLSEVCEPVTARTMKK